MITHDIRQQGGVVGDFQGDAAMGFWGWPLPQKDAVLRTCRAALAVRAEFEATKVFMRASAWPRARRWPARSARGPGESDGFRPGRESGFPAGGHDQDPPGPHPIGETTARSSASRCRDVARVRRLAIVRPYGLDAPLEVSELLPPVSQYPELTD